MAEFQEENLEQFLSVVRKYMALRGPYNQKELAEITETGVSTMSRFLNNKITELNPLLIIKIVAKLNIPLHEIIDFVDESYTDRFMRMVKLYRAEADTDPDNPLSSAPLDEALEDELDGGQNQTAQREVRGKIKIAGRERTISYQSDGSSDKKKMTIAEKIADLSPRQKAYLQDFLGLDMEGRDLIVDLGNNLFRYFKQKGMDL